MVLRGRSGALAERDFRLLFAATTITTVGDRLASIALAFAVLDVSSATGLGLVLAVRQATEAAVLVLGGVLSDRLPRHLVLTGASLLQGVAQVVTAWLVIAEIGGVGALMGAQVFYGLGAGLVLPAEVGLVPQTVSPERLQQANALQGLTRNIVGVLGPALGGALVVAGSPGVALAVDAASFFVCAELLRRILVAPRDRAASSGFLADLREGWHEFTSRTWLWASVVFFGLGNFFFAGWIVLGPLVANEELGGCRSLVGGADGWRDRRRPRGIVAMRVRPTRPLVACVLAAVPISLQSMALAVVAPVWVIALASFAGGLGIAVHLTLWFTVFQQQVPERAQSRVSSYDTLGSFVLLPIGMAVVGPVSEMIGVAAALWLAVAAMWASWAAILSLPSVWRIRPAPPGLATESA